MKIKELTAENFDSEINAQTENALVDFWAPWCAPCRVMSAELESLAAQEDRFEIFRVNVDEQPRLAQRFSVTNIPTLMVFGGGNVLRRSVGAIPKEKIVALLD